MEAGVGQLRRGLQVFRRVCASCHSLALLRPADLVGLRYSRKQALAVLRRRKHSAYLELPYASKAQARRANNGVVPPDLSLVVKRASKSYVYNVLTGYTPGLSRAPDNLYYNRGFELGVTAMRPPLARGLIRYAPTVPATVRQYARDVVEFLVWVSEP